MKYKRNRLWELAGIVHRSEILLEGGDDEAGGDELDTDDAAEDDTGGDLFGDEGGDTDVGGGEEGTEEDAEEGAGEEEEEEEKVEVLTTAEIAKYGTGEFETELDKIFMNIFDQAQGRAKVKSQTSIGYPGHQEELEETKKYSLKILLESEEHASEFDLVYFTNEIARYIKNYETLMDIEGILFSKAKQFLYNQRSEEEGDIFEDLLAREHGLTFSSDDIYPKDKTAPAATGARDGGGGV